MQPRGRTVSSSFSRVRPKCDSTGAAMSQRTIRSARADFGLRVSSSSKMRPDSFRPTKGETGYSKQDDRPAFDVSKWVRQVTGHASRAGKTQRGSRLPFVVAREDVRQS